MFISLYSTNLSKSIEWLLVDGYWYIIVNDSLVFDMEFRVHSPVKNGIDEKRIIEQLIINRMFLNCQRTDTGTDIVPRFMVCNSHPETILPGSMWNIPRLGIADLPHPESIGA